MLKGDSGWPEILADLKGGEPKELWYEGEWNLKLFENAACVVGSRHITEYGRRVTDKLVAELVGQGRAIVSGFMYGVDQQAHRQAVRLGGKTVAVLGYGICYPLRREEQKLKEEIIAHGGLVLSEWKDQNPARWTFATRNRIGVALSADIFVVEAAEKSGALISAGWAVKLKRQLWTVPGPITSPVSVGTNRLLVEGTAKIWVGGVPKGDAVRTINQTDLYIALQNDIHTIDELAKKTGKSVAEVGSELTLLQLAGKVEERSGTYYVTEGK